MQTNPNFVTFLANRGFHPQNDQRAVLAPPPENQPFYAFVGRVNDARGAGHEVRILLHYHPKHYKPGAQGFAYPHRMYIDVDGKLSWAHQIKVVGVYRVIAQFDQAVQTCIGVAAVRGKLEDPRAIKRQAQALIAGLK